MIEVRDTEGRDLAALSLRILESLGYQVDYVDPDGRHRYIATRCRHDDHEGCSARTATGEHGEEYTKHPASCKGCRAVCRCTCHRNEIFGVRA